MICDVSALKDLDELDKASLLTRYREILLQAFTFGFEVLVFAKLNYSCLKYYVLVSQRNVQICTY